jgi:hypothetical protein
VIRWIIAALAVLGGLSIAHAAIYRVGPQQPNKSLKAIIGRLRPGDLVEVSPGAYHENMKITVSGTKDAPIVIRGVADQARPVFDAEGLDCSGSGPVPRGQFQIEGAYVVLEHLEITGARNGGQGDGVRFNGSPYAIIRDCKIHHNDNGVFSNDSGTTIVEQCEVFSNGADGFAGYSHNFYMHSEHLIVGGCTIHDSHTGQNFKSRSHFTELRCNFIAASDDGEVGLVEEKGLTDRPNSNALLVGNIIVSSINRPNGANAARFIEFGSEGNASRDGTLYLFNNTFVAGNTRNALVAMRDAKARLVCCNNIFLGTDNLVHLAQPALSVAGRNNFVGPAARAPAEFADTIKGANPGFLNLDKLDFRLRLDSPCVGRGIGKLEYEDGDGHKQTAALDHSFLPPLKLIARPAKAAPDLGAYDVKASTSVATSTTPGPAGSPKPVPTTAKDTSKPPVPIGTPPPSVTTTPAADLLKLAQLYIDSDLTDKAKEALAEIIKSYPDTDAAKQAAEKLKALGTKESPSSLH